MFPHAYTEGVWSLHLRGEAPSRSNVCLLLRGLCVVEERRTCTHTPNGMARRGLKNERPSVCLRLALVGVCASFLLGSGSAVPDDPPGVRSEAPIASRPYCGIDSLYLICRLLGRDVDWQAIWNGSRANGDTVSFRDLARCAARLHMATRGAKLTFYDLGRLNCHSILFLPPPQRTGVGHVIVALPSLDSSVWVCDPPMPARRVSQETLATVWDGAALLVASSEGILDRDLRRLGLHGTWSGAGFALTAAAGVCVVCLVVWIRARRRAGGD